MKRPLSRLGLTGLLCALTLPAWASFTDNGDGTITDTITGLMWDKCSIGQTWDNASPPGTCTGTAGSFDWTSALVQATVVNGAVGGYRGHTDWRLPNVNELESLVKLNAINPAIDETAFPATPTGWDPSYYWSSTSLTTFPDAAWIVVFFHGATFPYYKTNTYRVRLVRSGQGLGAFDLLNSPPVLTGPAVTSTAPNAASLQATSSEAATGYWIAVLQGSAPPTAAQVQAGVPYGGVPVAAAGSGPMAAGTPSSFAVSGLTPSAAYTFYIMAANTAGQLSLAPVSVNLVMPTPASVPTLGEGLLALLAAALGLLSARRQRQSRV